MSAFVDALIRLAEVAAALAVAEDAVIYADLVEHARGDLARESAVIFPMNILCTNVDVRAKSSISNSSKSRSRRTYDNRYLCVFDERSQTANEVLALDDRVVHFPVACNNRSSCHFKNYLLNIHQKTLRFYMKMRDYLSASAAMPGISLPSRNSSVAPPPVETCEILSVRPVFLRAATESPPPTMETAPFSVALATA